MKNTSAVIPHKKVTRGKYFNHGVLEELRQKRISLQDTYRATKEAGDSVLYLLWSDDGKCIHVGMSLNPKKEPKRLFSTLNLAAKQLPQGTPRAETFSLIHFPSNTDERKMNEWRRKLKELQKQDLADFTAWKELVTCDHSEKAVKKIVNSLTFHPACIRGPQSRVNILCFPCVSYGHGLYIFKEVSPKGKTRIVYAGKAGGEGRKGSMRRRIGGHFRKKKNQESYAEGKCRGNYIEKVEKHGYRYEVAIIPFPKPGHEEVYGVSKEKLETLLHYERVLIARLDPRDNKLKKTLFCKPEPDPF
jgi:hypothetical protein